MAVFELERGPVDRCDEFGGQHRLKHAARVVRLREDVLEDRVVAAFYALDFFVLTHLMLPRQQAAGHTLTP